MTSAMTLYPNQVTFWATGGVRASTYEFEGTRFNLQSPACLLRSGHITAGRLCRFLGLLEQSNTHLLSHSSRAWSLKSRWQRPLPLEPIAESASSLPASGGHSSLAVTACCCITLISASVVTWFSSLICLSMCVSGSIFPSFNNHTGLRGHPKHLMLVNLTAFAMTLFPNSHVDRYQRLGLQHTFLGNTVQPLTDHLVVSNSLDPVTSVPVSCGEGVFMRYQIAISGDNLLLLGKVWI